MKRVSFDQLKTAASEAGLQVKQCGKGHAQLIGGISIVNFYNGNKGTTIYVQGTAGGRKISCVKEAINAAMAVPKRGQVKRASRKRYKGVKRRKWSQSKVCHWCKVPFESFADCTADHVVPLSKGGSNGDDNIVLACKACNERRKNNVSAEEIRSTRADRTVANESGR